MEASQAHVVRVDAGTGGGEPPRARPAARAAAWRAVLAAGAAIPGAVACAPDTPGVTRIYACYHSDFERPALVVARTAEAWRALWPRINRCADGAPPPRVDFARRAVLVAAFGYAGSTGHEITIDSLTRRGDTTRVHASRVNPGLDCVVGAMVTSPVAAATAALAPGPVVLVTREVEREHCS